MSIDWSKEIERLCAEREWTLKALAGDLGISQAYLSEVIHGRRPPSALLKIKLAGRLGWNKTSDFFEELLPEDAANAWREWDDRTTKELGEKSEKKLEKRERKKKEAAE